MHLLIKSCGRPVLRRVSQRFYRIAPSYVPPTTADDSIQRSLALRQSAPQISALIDAYRNHGFKVAEINPLSNETDDRELVPELYPSSYSLSADDKVKIPDGLLSFGTGEELSVLELTDALESVYCGSIGAEISHLSTAERDWFADRMERRCELYPFSDEDAVRSACLMKRALELNRFLSVKFATVKRYSGEGAESMLVAVDHLFSHASQLGVGTGVIGMPHRGRNDLLTCLLGHPLHPYFLKMRGRSEYPETSSASGDTFSHFHFAGRVKFGVEESAVDVSVLPNPSHLEAVTPVAVGKARAKMLTLGDGDYAPRDWEHARNGDAVICLLMHGDASISGQGVVAETATMANLPHFAIGGSVHLVVNNQLGFTTEPALGHSFRHPTDLAARGLAAPVLHVNADSVAEVARAARLAVDFRQTFRRDVFLNLVCYRRWGHNELDDPSLTQPLMYARIDGRRPLPDTFAAALGDAARRDVEAATVAWTATLQSTLRAIDQYQPAVVTFGGRWAAIGPAPASHLLLTPTGVARERLREVGLASVALPDGFKCHPTLVRHHVEKRRERLQSGRDIDWATAEALAVGTLLQEGAHCRISGQDVGRGTFSHRHWMLVDQTTDAVAVPLNHALPPRLDADGHPRPRGRLEVANSALSEEAVLSFEYGYSVEDPSRLVVWEAQFGDFFNAAQVPIDTYISSAETKWQFQSGLVLLLPHGYDGAGPEHSSARIERFLQLTDSRETARPPDGEDRNMIVANPTTPAQYFHLLRRQLKRPWRKPLVVVAPKLILRLPAASSTLDEMAEGTYFHHVIADPLVISGRIDRTQVRRVILCSGKHYYALVNARSQYEAWDTAIVRLEQLCPFPVVEVAREMAAFPNARAFVWSQEEHRNMGAWGFVRSRVEAALGVQLEYAGRAELATAAVGIAERHTAESEALLAASFGQSA